MMIRNIAACQRRFLECAAQLGWAYGLEQEEAAARLRAYAERHGVEVEVAYRWLMGGGAAAERWMRMGT